MGYKQEIQAKKPTRQKLAHNERPNDLPDAVDWDEQERIKANLKNRHLEPIIKGPNHYTPERGAELCILRRQGMSARMISEKVGINQTTIGKWITNYPEFAQEWHDCYSNYILNVAEELVPRAEAMIEGLKLNGKKLPAKLTARYMRAMERLSIEAHWAAAHRVPALYGDADNGSELVIIQPQELERTVTQDVPAALAWKEEVERALGETGMPSPNGSDGTERQDAGEDHSEGPGGTEPPGSEGVTDKRRKPRRLRPLLEPRKPFPDVKPRLDLHRGRETQGPDNPGQ
jgi:hypothetical protein